MINEEDGKVVFGFSHNEELSAPREEGNPILTEVTGTFRDGFMDYIAGVK
jgi:hypothetical protein